jgi:hypothetical protein
MRQVVGRDRPQIALAEEIQRRDGDQQYQDDQDEKASDEAQNKTPAASARGENSLSGDCPLNPADSDKPAFAAL